ncbi:MAG TPA: thioredoxin domain-containing protein, partial [Dehalococcoidia bacterium]|nr:thioredoxin domain-containing protein [Dehalococcoidia bacterium]
THGGFGEAPKFPQPMILEFLLQTFTRTHDQKVLEMVEHTLTRMARGGIYDQLGGGFHRYSTDHRWLVPHFEKMLYDNALLSRVYLHAYQVTGNPFYRRIAEETLDYVRRGMTDPKGGFYATQDADSEGEEGKFYLWTALEIEQALGPEDARIVSRYFGVLAAGNFEGTNILHVPEDIEAVARELGISADEVERVVERSRPRLLAAREGRIRPGKDDKVIAAWNGLMLRSFAEAAAALGREDYRETAVANAEFLLSTLYQHGRLLRTYRAGQAKLNAYLEDYAFYAAGLLALYEATFDLRWFKAARELADAMCRLFWDEMGGDFFETSPDHETLVHRPKELMDNATPAGNSVAVEALLRLHRLTGSSVYYDKVARTLQAVAQLTGQYPTAFGHLLGVLDMYLSPSQEIAVVGSTDDPGTQALLALVLTHYLPRHVIALAESEDDEAVDEFELLEDRFQVNGRPTAYVCENFTCRLPVNEPAALAEQLGIA